MTNFQTVTATSIVTEKVASIVPTTYVSTMKMTEKMLPITVYMTSTKTQAGQVTTLVERIPETATITSTQTERAITTAVSTVSVKLSCSTTTVISNVPISTTVTSIVTEMRPITLTQKNVMTVALPGQIITSTVKVGSTSTVSVIATVTQLKSVTLACPLQEKTITRIMSIPAITSNVIIPTSAVQVMTSKAVIPKSTVPFITSNTVSSGSVCPTPASTSPKTSAKAQNTTTTTSITSASTCQNGQKRCDMYDRRHYNECRGGQWSAGIPMTEADNMQCEESNGDCKLVPIPASNFHV